MKVKVKVTILHTFEAEIPNYVKKDKDSINDNKICNDYSNIRIHTIIDIKKKPNINNEQFKKNLDILQNDKHVLDNLFEEEDKDDINSNNFHFNFDKNLQINDKDFGL
mgnify:CR=1 FL=1